MLYRATAGELRGSLLPLSFIDSAEYWGVQVCQQSAAICAISDRYDAQAYTLRPDKSAAGDLQTERVNIHNGANIYDAATWQIAVTLASVRAQQALAADDAYQLINNQNRLLQLGYSGDARLPVPHQNRALTQGDLFTYNGKKIADPRAAFVFRTLPRSWLSIDPIAGSRFDGWIKAVDLPENNPQYQRGKISWTDWKPITGENAWAFLIGPLQAAHIYFIEAKKQRFVPFQELAVQNALAVLPTFAAMQSAIGAVYYAPAGTVANQGEELVSRYEVSVENNFSVYAGLNILRETLNRQLQYQHTLTPAQKNSITQALTLIRQMLEGGSVEGRKTEGLLAFFKKYAWIDGEFVQGGYANDPTRKAAWVPRLSPRAVDVNTWGIAALGAKQIDQWFGFGVAFENWQRVKNWGGYGSVKVLAGVGFSDLDGNGVDASGNYRQGVLSVEWTAGAINAVRLMRSHYHSVSPESAEYADAQRFIADLNRDEKSMLSAIQKLQKGGAYLYANQRYRIPFGWYANPLPSTCSTAWMVMVEQQFNPFAHSSPGL